jgi:predicted ATP-binding protein involved in virulence
VYATYLLDLTVRNVRCFGPEEQTLRLSDSQGRPAMWTVILGDNGVGKTTLLQCLVALEPHRHFLAVYEEARPLVRLPTHPSEEWRIYRNPNRADETSVQGHVAAGEASRGVVEIRVPTNGRLVNLKAKSDDRLRGLRCYAYGAARRMGSASSVPTVEDPAASLFLDNVALVDVEEWLLVEDYALRRAPSDNTARRLGRVKQVLTDLLPDAEDLRIQESRTSPKPKLEVKTPYGWVGLSDLSLGYRTMIAWTVDLASRLFERYPDSPNPLAEPAIVLVDEVDLHLHPKWQRELRRHLTERFPNTQFVVTAHSPLVVQASENENIVVLRREGDHVVIDNDVETIRGWRVDQVLTSDLFGLKTARPPEYDEIIAQRNEILARRSLDVNDRARLRSLGNEIEKLPAGETPADLEAMEIIRQAAAKLKNR